MAICSEVKRLEIKVSDMVGEFAITQDDGQEVYDRIHPELRKGQAVLLDFSHVRVIASPFLNMAVGQLLDDVPYGDINRCIETKGLSRQDVNLLERVIANAREYYENPDTQRAVDKAITNVAQDL